MLQIDSAENWTNKKTYPLGAIVRYSGCIYIAECKRSFGTVQTCIIGETMLLKLLF